MLREEWPSDEVSSQAGFQCSAWSSELVAWLRLVSPTLGAAEA
jgi:hypothetical protein